MPHEPVHPFTVRHLQGRWGLTGASKEADSPDHGNGGDSAALTEYPLDYVFRSKSIPKYK